MFQRFDKSELSPAVRCRKILNASLIFKTILFSCPNAKESYLFFVDFTIDIAVPNIKLSRIKNNLQLFRCVYHFSLCRSQQLRFFCVLQETPRTKGKSSSANNKPFPRIRFYSVFGFAHYFASTSLIGFEIL